MTQISSMFLRNLTCIDHAYVDQNGHIIGGSVHPDIHVTGPIDSEEQVVVDFSRVKKQIKNIIDDKENGFDHKLWVIKGYSDCQVKFDENDYVRIISPHFVLTAPRDAIKIIENSNVKFLRYSDQSRLAEEQMSKEISDGLTKENGVDISVDLKLRPSPFSENGKMFTYFHGLKKSSSWGCNNIAHGHTSFTEVYDDAGLRVEVVEEMIARFLDSKMLVYKDNIVGENKIEYTTSRGKFSLSYDETFKVEYMDRETTVENIVDYVCEKLDIILKHYNVSSVFISEGLQKGALKKFDYINKF